MRRGLSAAGRPNKTSSRLSRRAGVNASTFTAPSISDRTNPDDEVETVDAVSTIKLLEAIEALYPLLALIHVFLDNASYHHAKIMREWLAQPGRRIKLHFIPAYCPHLNPIERLWGVMHRNITHNKTYATCTQFADATLEFLREKVPRSWAQLRDSVTDNFRVISPKDFRVVTGYTPAKNKKRVPAKNKKRTCKLEQSMYN